MFVVFSMIYRSVFLFILCNFVSGSPALVENFKIPPSHNDGKIDPDELRNVTELITSKGFPCEQHYVTTKDGYILSIQRIPYSKKSPTQKGKPVILLQHGFLSCSSCWVDNLVNESLGFLLADAGVDVWMGNNRGNKYSRSHASLSPSDPRFWEFSWDEMGKYDLPAMIDYILNQTGSTELYYAGHSQGTEQAFAGFSQDIELGKKLFLELFGKYEIFPNTKLFTLFAQDSCRIKAIDDIICANIFFLLGGYDSPQFNLSRVPVYVKDHPSGSSVQNLLHYSQSVLHGQFQMFDYGSPESNLKHYNQTTPPLYDVTKMETPVALFTGGNDWLADPKDVETLLPNLKNIRSHKNIPEWEHLDFIWALNAPTQCYNDIINMIKNDNK
ncbi:lysosomal acid lipase/cholesteryl ester hydrolase-like isoform X2 [Ostrea edulis]|uniref:lysosomal acid lipase/cholesteryl ester hydrolase-like isoform X2 n=1 Tax=Ostrea edulis TaxID=37623 RepID=UPI0024AF03F1|nr:lysosomal acid lipase/cholesteryl ester hydrolase-like isoform X2 [Ostrea edulis]